MIWNIVSDSSCDLRTSDFQSDSVLFHSVPLRIQVGEREFVDNDALEVPEMLEAMAAEKALPPRPAPLRRTLPGLLRLGTARFASQFPPISPARITPR